ncbi:ATP-binding protein [Streptomyces sp. NPDC101225]|uniref:ATP-binding protein n=1 Tax=Streptomyces sp. NPDC101225 TaxID=3366135 RepID=UPI0037FEB6C2
MAEPATDAAPRGRVPGRDVRLTLHVVAGTLRTEVTDTRGDRLPHRRPAAADAASGRGPVLVDARADKWGVAPGDTAVLPRRPDTTRSPAAPRRM